MTSRLHGIQADCGRSYREIEGIAQSIRRHLGVGPSACFDAHGFFEFKLDEFILDADGREIPMVHGVSEMKSEALTRWDVDASRLEILLSEDWYQQLCDGHPRARYSVAHEFGHTVLHTNQLIRLAELNVASQVAMHRGGSDHPPYMDTEWQANAFASALLMPACGIRDLEEQFGLPATPRLLAATFGVSSEAASYRLEVYSNGKTGL